MQKYCSREVKIELVIADLCNALPPIYSDDLIRMMLGLE